jgi:bifunctional non-homologous end joining protein LigD
MADALAPYRQKRDFAVTSEPRGRTARTGRLLSFVVQKHAATRLHYDFRLELQGTLKSWAIPKGPSLDPADKRMAVHVEDHPLDYASFEGEIPPRQYGAGHVIVWDRGTWEPVGDPVAGYRTGKLKFVLHGEKLRGGWTLVRMRGREGERQEPWLLIKERDAEARPAGEYSLVDAQPNSVLSGMPLPEEKAASARARSAVREGRARSSAPGAPKRGGRAGEPPWPADAPRAALPETFEPELATLVAAPPAGDDWRYEVKFDGYRILARVDRDAVRLVTRNGNDWTERLARIADDLRARRLEPCWLDGEIVVLDARGVSDFGALQRAFDGHGEAIRYMAFDLPFGGGRDLRAHPLEERRRLLAALLGDDTERVRYSHGFDASAEEILAQACRLHLEGVIGKRRGSPYRAGRTRDWIKLKCSLRQEFVIGGYTAPRGSRTGLGSLLLGVHDMEGRLRYAGNVGTGFDTPTLADLKQRLLPLERAASPFVDGPRARASWVEPALVAEVSFAEWTGDGKVRQAVFHGLRGDKPARAITREEAQPAPKARAKPASGTPLSRAPGSASAPDPPADATASAARASPVRVTHPEREVDARSGATKRDVVDWYVHAARRMLPHLAGRPVALLRAPSGLAGPHVFQKHKGTLRIEGLKELPTRLDPGHPPLIEIDTFESLVSAAQFNALEFHTWNALAARIEKPDRMTFDLDPGEGVAWRAMQEATGLVREVLDALGLVPFLKTSGGKGLHVVVPLEPKDGWSEVREFSRAVVERLARVAPERFVAKSGAKNRVGRIFVDYLRNGRGATTVAAWSLRARPGLGVSVPCAWDELPDVTGGDHWTVANAHERLESAVDPWPAYGLSAKTLGAARRALATSA